MRFGAEKPLKISVNKTNVRPILSASKKRKSGKTESGLSYLTITADAMLRDGSDAAYRQFVEDCIAFSVRLLAVRDGYAKVLGVTGAQYLIIVTVAHLGKKGEVSISDVAKRLHQSSSFITNETNKLVKANLISKRKDEVDRRRTILEITPEGWKRFDRLSKIQPEVNNIHFDCLTSEKFDEMREIMPRLVNSTDRALSLLRHRISELESSS